VSEVARGAWAIVQRDARLFLSYRLRPLTALVTPTFSVALFYEVSRLVSDARFPAPRAYFDFAVVGLALLPLLRAGVLGPVVSLREELIAGTFDRLALSPLGAPTCLLATLVFPFALAILSGAVILLVAVALFGLRLQWSTAPLAIPLGLLDALALAPLSVVLLAAGVLVKSVSSGVGWLLTGLSLLGGVYFPVALLPNWIRWAGDAQPLTPALSLLRHVLTGAPSPVGTELEALAAFAAVGLTLTTALLSAACRRARRQGTLFEY
jgi:ABC-2 type transport system permease protein